MSGTAKYTPLQRQAMRTLHDSGMTWTDVAVALGYPANLARSIRQTACYTKADHRHCAVRSDRPEPSELAVERARVDALLEAKGGFGGRHNVRVQATHPRAAYAPGTVFREANC